MILIIDIKCVADFCGGLSLVDSSHWSSS